MAKGNKKAGERFQAPTRTIDGRFATHRVGARPPVRQTTAEADRALMREMGFLKREPKPRPKPKKGPDTHGLPKVGVNAAVSSPSTVDLNAAVARLRDALSRSG